MPTEYVNKSLEVVKEDFITSIKHSGQVLFDPNLLRLTLFLTADQNCSMDKAEENEEQDRHVCILRL
jgi:hypothetical protein